MGIGSVTVGRRACHHSSGECVGGGKRGQAPALRSGASPHFPATACSINPAKHVRRRCCRPLPSVPSVLSVVKNAVAVTTSALSACRVEASAETGGKKSVVVIRRTCIEFARPVLYPVAVERQTRARE